MPKGSPLSVCNTSSVHCLVSSPSPPMNLKSRSFIMFFLQIFIQNVLYRGILLLSLGMLSKKQWALRPSHAALRLFPRWQGGWPAAAQAAWSRNAMPRRLCLQRKMSWWISGEIFLSVLPFPYLEQHMAQPTPWKTEVKNTDADFQMQRSATNFLVYIFGQTCL